VRGYIYCDSLLSKRKGKKTEPQEEIKHVFFTETEITCPLNMRTLWFNKSLYCILSMIFSFLKMKIVQIKGVCYSPFFSPWEKIKSNTTKETYKEPKNYISEVILHTHNSRTLKPNELCNLGMYRFKKIHVLTLWYHTNITESN